MAYRLILPVAALLASLTAVGFAAGAESAADPTRPPAGLTAGNPSGTASTGPVLQSVIVGKGRRSAAIIGGQRAELGGSYGEAILTRIGEAEVELQGPSGRQVLRMTPEAVKRPLSSAPQHSRGRNATVDPFDQTMNINAIKAVSMLACLMSLAACSSTPIRSGETYDRISDELRKAGAEPARTARPAAVDRALLAPPVAASLGSAAKEPRFDLVVSNAPAAQVFMAIVSGTRYSMLLPPELAGTITVNLKNVTVRDALDTVRDLYGYEYQVKGTRIFIQPVALQTRVFQVNYLFGSRQGRSDVRVTSGSIAVTNPASQAGAVTTTGAAQPTTQNQAQESSRVVTESQSDFWGEVTQALKAIVGAEGGRGVVVSPQTGVIVVKAFPTELRNVESYLRATKLVIERQVMLEAKIVEVSLSDGYQAGINWAAFARGGNHRLSAGVISPGTVLQKDGDLFAGGTSIDTATQTVVDASLAAAAGTNLVSAVRNVGGLFGLAFQTSNFAAILQFLETQGGVQVLSSPRIAALNNQKAVLKVGTDDFFITNISTTTTTTTSGSIATPTITVQPFFSGIALDVMPQIDEDRNIILHVHPSVSSVGSEKSKNVNLGTLGSFTLPLASSMVNESDTVVRVQDGNIVAIGGLMKQEQTSDRSQVPGVGNLPIIGELFRQTSRGYSKSELVILLKPTVIQGDQGWQQGLAEVQGRLDDLDPRRLP